MKKIIVKTIKAVLRAAFWIILWHLAAMKVDLEVILPSPAAVAFRLLELMRDGEFYLTAFTSLLRVLTGIIAGVLIGCICAVLTANISVLDTLLSPAISVIKSVPVASFIILLMLWVDKNFLPAFITFLIVFPLAWANISTGIKTAPKNLLEIAKVYKFDPMRKVLHIYIPSLIPFFISTAKSALGLAWKAGIAAEVLAVPAIAIGSEIYLSKNFFETTDLFAWTIVTLVLSVMVESLIGGLLSRLSRKYDYRSEENEHAEN